MGNAGNINELDFNCIARLSNAFKVDLIINNKITRAFQPSSAYERGK